VRRPGSLASRILQHAATGAELYPHELAEALLQPDPQQVRLELCRLCLSGYLTRVARGIYRLKDPHPGA